MRRDDHLLKTMSAAKVCIAECLQAPSPHDLLGKHLDSLRSDPKWSAAEVAEVEATARKVLDAAGRRSGAAPNCGWPLTSHAATPLARS